MFIERAINISAAWIEIYNGTVYSTCFRTSRYALLVLFLFVIRGMRTRICVRFVSEMNRHRKNIDKSSFFEEKYLCSKTACRGFKSFCPCQNEKESFIRLFFVCANGLEKGGLRSMPGRSGLPPPAAEGYGAWNYLVHETQSRLTYYGRSQNGNRIPSMAGNKNPRNEKISASE